MALEIEKKERESTQSLIRRFSKAIKKSGILQEARQKRFFKRALSDKTKKKAALKKIQRRSEYEKKDKLGLIKSRYAKYIKR